MFLLFYFVIVFVTHGKLYANGYDLSKTPSQIAAVVNCQFVLLVQSFTLLKGPLTYLLGLLLEKILAVQLKLLLPCISHFIAQYLLAILIYRCKYDVIGPHH